MKSKTAQANLQLHNVTLCAVSSVRIDATMKALTQSMQGVDYKKVVFLTNENPNVSGTGIERIKIRKLDYNGYSRFVLYDLQKYIDTEYVLLVQHDGYVLRPDKWDDRFFEYDYIGAPWAKDVHFTKEGENVRVGNGGFTFRSQKLLTAFTKLNLPFTDNGTGYFHEDGVISVYHRKKLEKHGIKFPPVDIAARFSREFPCEDSQKYPFGFHNLRNVPALQNYRSLLQKLSIPL